MCGRLIASPRVLDPGGDPLILRVQSELVAFGVNVRRKSARIYAHD
jgi:hypothetical protein